MARIRPDALIQKIPGLNGGQEVVPANKPQIKKLKDSVVNELRERPTLEEAKKLSAELVNTTRNTESEALAEAHGAGLTEDRVRALLFDDE